MYGSRGQKFECVPSTQCPDGGEFEARSRGWALMASLQPLQSLSRPTAVPNMQRAKHCRHKHIQIQKQKSIELLCTTSAPASCWRQWSVCDSDVACAVRLQKHMAVKHMAHRKWPGKDTAVKFTTQPQMRHRRRGGAEERRATWHKTQFRRRQPENLRRKHQLQVQTKDTLSTNKFFLR